MNFVGFTEADFQVFEVEGLEPRMTQLKATLRPKLEQLGLDLAPFLQDQLQMEMYAHVAKHARRKTNPPNDSWVAFSHNPRGYKMFPHFQVGAWATHVFIQWGVIYESPHKAHVGELMSKRGMEWRNALPDLYFWYPDHMNNQGIPNGSMTEQEFAQLSHRLINQKNGELMVGLEVKRDEAIQMSGHDFLQLSQKVFESLIPLHLAAIHPS